MELLVPVLQPLKAEGVSARGRPVHVPTQRAVACPSSGLMAAPVGAALRRFLPAFMSRKIGTAI